jgi:hypothetical protein
MEAVGSACVAERAVRLWSGRGRMSLFLQECRQWYRLRRDARASRDEAADLLRALEGQRDRDDPLVRTGARCQHQVGEIIRGLWGEKDIEEGPKLFDRQLKCDHLTP